MSSRRFHPHPPSNLLRNRHQHMLQRAGERYGLVISRNDERDLIVQAVSGKAKLIENQVLKGIYEGEIRGKIVRYVYHYVTRQLVTFLDPTWSRLGQTEVKPLPKPRGT